MTSVVKGFPDKFPVRDDDRRPLRYRTASLLSRLYVRLLSRRRLRIVGVENIPLSGPLLVACNHTSNLDPMVVGGFFPRTLFAMAKRELYFTPIVAWFLAGCNCIPVDRGGADRRAVTRALEVLRRRGRLLIFVEGTRSRDGTMHRAEAGVGFLARRSGATVLPVAISTENLADGRGMVRRKEIVLRYGPAFVLELGGRRDDPGIADEIARRVAALLPAARRGVYGDHVALTNPPAIASDT
jgi:1-acyl-sn-glycerol-3-phosphate acyltransferase